jgi:hypothetical protein
MKTALAAFALLAFACLLGVSIWATGHQNVVLAINDLKANAGGGNNPWFVATLFDAYFGFLWFWLWTAYRSRSWLVRAVWLVLILSGGNMAMAAYVLIALWRLPAEPTVADLLLRPASPASASK